jgi:hemerythrin
MMIEWESKFEVGNDLIDQEHRTFVDLIKNVDYSVDEDLDSEYIARLLIEIEKYADFHFYSEENIMLSSGYPDLKYHQELHRSLLSRLQQFIKDYQAGAVEASAVIGFLMDWFRNHTAGEDLRIAQFINEKNANSAAF